MATTTEANVYCRARVSVAHDRATAGAAILLASVQPKVINGKTCYYLVESARVGGKPRIVSQRYLGSAQDITAALDGASAVPALTRLWPSAPWPRRGRRWSGWTTPGSSTPWSRCRWPRVGSSCGVSRL